MDKPGTDAMSESETPAETPPRQLSPAAQRALDEAKARRAEIDAAAELPREILGRAGPEPVRYGDWENKGIASDF